MGVWIEIIYSLLSNFILIVAPFVGVWIEIEYSFDHTHLLVVAPFVGVWIEIFAPGQIQ